MKNFILKGLKPPGRISMPGIGILDLESIDDNQAEELWRGGLPFVEPTPEYRLKIYPDKSPGQSEALPEAHSDKSKPGKRKKA